MTKVTNTDTIESDLFEIEGCDDMNGEYAIFTNCKMLRDFGPIQKDCEFEAVKISFQDGRFIEFYNNDELHFKIPYMLVVDNDKLYSR